MNPVELLLKTSSKTSPGKPPGYSAAHVLYALILLSEGAMGRKRLSEALELGEGSTRTLLERLASTSLIQVSRRGVELSSLGREVLAGLGERLRFAKAPPTGVTVDEANWAVLVRGAAGKVRLGVEQRDQALLHGATGATTLIYQGGGWVIPGLEQEPEGPLRALLSELGPEEGDVVIIGSSDSLVSAAVGALAAAIDLLS